MSSTMTTSIVASEKDPRTTDEFKTYAVDGGKDLSAYIFYSKLNAQGVKPTEKDLPHLSGEFADPRRVVIRDARGQDQLKLDDCGFEYFSQPVPEADYADDNSIRQIYYPALIRTLMARYGVSKVLPFDHRVRNSGFNTKYGTDYDNYTGPVIRPHVDMAPVHAGTFLRRILGRTPEAIPQYEGPDAKRWAVINVWRPLRTICRDPFCVADATTVTEETDQLLHVAYEGTWRQTESYLTLGGEEGKHQWWYMSEQTPEDVLAFKIFDSRPKRGDARMVPHTGFRGLEGDNAPPRYSIELRCWVAWD